MPFTPASPICHCELNKQLLKGCLLPSLAPSDLDTSVARACLSAQFRSSLTDCLVWSLWVISIRGDTYMTSALGGGKGGGGYADGVREVACIY